ncbi:DUF5361 domain-containing protein [Aeriscardovia aeriphila]|uniref:Uncharacterized protein n=1 Tax=Aeriscardovia aeriphila TaxID=218139 RepID=A0A261FA96_9BIFI|nr:DUF5361 domain-containing protein [Aeriscardovia aeriphila]NYI25779.1 hypothetical protein [Aeriscardovia aeriphila]OZG56071.1 hypothetical protein AEAE_0559 [Aeriscardovia aeriphila]
MLEHADILQADFQRFYGLNLALLTHSLDVMRAANLAAHLPLDALIWRKFSKQAEWSTAEYLLANIADATAFLAWTKSKDAQLHGAKWKGQIKRPGQQTEQEKMVTAQAVSAETLARIFHDDIER